MVVALVTGAFAAEVRTGDVVFQRSESSQSALLAEATHSPWTHTGVVFVEPTGPVVLEAVEPVRFTPLATWAGHAADGRIAIHRLAHASELLTDAVVHQMRDLATAWVGKHYDLAFAWTDDRLYCSELVYELFHRAGVETAETRTFASFDLTSPAVQRAVAARWGARPPLDEVVVAPADLYADRRWISVCEGNVADCL